MTLWRPVLLILSLTASTSAFAWIHGYSDPKDPENTYCVMDGWFSGATKCVTRAQAKALDYDAKAIFGATEDHVAAAAQISGQMNTAKTRIDDLDNQTQAENRRLKGLQGDASDTSACKNGDVECFKAKVKAAETLQADIGKTNQNIGTLRQGLTAAQADLAKLEQSKDEQIRAAALSAEIKSHGLEASLDVLQNRVSSAREGLNAVSRAFENSIMEAYVYQKMKQMSENLCTAQAQCSAKTNEAPGALLKGVFNQKRIESNISRPAATGSGTN